MMQMLGLSAWQLGLIALSALLIGFSKTSVDGVVMIAIPLLTTAFGGKVSTGVILRTCQTNPINLYRSRTAPLFVEPDAKKMVVLAATVSHNTVLIFTI